MRLIKVSGKVFEFGPPGLINEDAVGFKAIAESLFRGRAKPQRAYIAEKVSLERDRALAGTTASERGR